MKKILTSLAFLACLAGHVKAADTVQIIGSTITANVVTVSSSAATLMDNGIRLNARTSIEIQNVDASTAIACGFNSGVTAATGRIITAGLNWPLPMRSGGPYGLLSVYCISVAPASVKAIVTQAY